MKLYCLALSKSAFDAVNISVATKSDLSLALVCRCQDGELVVVHISQH